MPEALKPDGPLLRIEPVSCASGQERLTALLEASLIVAVAMLAGLLAALAFSRLSPLSDPVDVVGVPLLTGYSESVEQWSFYVYVLTTLIVAGTVSWLRVVEKVPRSTIVPAGAAAMLVLSCLPAWCAWPSTLPAASLIGALAFLVGAFWVELGWGSARRSSRALVVALLVWGVGFPLLPVILLGNWRYVTGAVLVALTTRALYKRLPAAFRGEHADWRHASAALLVTFGTMITNGREFRFAAIGALGFLLGRRAGRSRQGLSALGTPDWLAYIASLVWSFSLVGHWSVLGPLRTVLTVAGGAGAAAVLALVFPSGLFLRQGQSGFEAKWEKWFPFLAVVGLVLTNLSRPWFGLLIAGSALLIAATRLRPMGRSLGAFALAGVLMLAILPGPPSTTIDPFHHGQILESVWEFESGRPLYSEVFPLRSYEFFLTWLARRVANPTLANYFIADRLFDSLPIAAVCLLTFAWTRSLPWSFATALGAATYPPSSSRMALPLLAAALGIAVFRSRRPLSLAWIAVGGWIAALLGFDVLIPLIGASLLTVAVAGPPRGSHRRGGPVRMTTRIVFERLGATVLLLLATMVPFLVFLALWQGVRAAFAYCWLLVDNARNLPAFYGLPLPWNDLDARLLMTSGLVLIGSWVAVGALARPFLSESRRRIWVFLVVTYVLVAHRGLGRSDPAHLLSLVFPNLVLTSLALFEGLRLLAHRGVRSPLASARVMAFAAMVVACWLSAQGRNDPNSVRRWIREVSGRADCETPRSTFILERVGPEDYLWEMENGMLNYFYQRHNPTRHSITYTICSPAEQRAVIESLRAHPPRLIVWRYLSGSNGIPNPLRYYLIAQYLYRHFRPVTGEGAPFLEPSPPGWAGRLDLEWPFVGPLPLGRLALRWGKDRIQDLARRVRGRKTLGPWSEHRGAGGSGTRADRETARFWEAEGPIDSRSFNYLKLDLACRIKGDSPLHVVEAVLEFAPLGRGYDANSPVSFDVIPDGAVHAYLIPIGCSPGWSWRTGIARIRVSIRAADRVSPPRGECWQIDKIGAVTTESGPPRH